MSEKSQELSVILPCLNEEKSLGFCIDNIKNISNQKNLQTEIIVVDNGSTDNSKKIAIEKKVNLIHEPKRGYGNAYLAGIKRVSKDNIIMVDPDGSYNLNDIPNFLDNLKKNDFILGNRFNKKMERGAMHFLNKQGNKIMRLLLRINGIKTKEVCTGFIGIKRDKLSKLNLKQTGMEFSSEFLIEVKKNNLKAKEIDINFKKRIGKSKLRRFRDGFRHFKYLLNERLSLPRR